MSYLCFHDNSMKVLKVGYCRILSTHKFVCSTFAYKFTIMREGTKKPFYARGAGGTPPMGKKFSTKKICKGSGGDALEGTFGPSGSLACTKFGSKPHIMVQLPKCLQGRYH